MIPSSGYAARSASTPLEPFQFERREPGPTDVLLDITHCGVCHTDLHQARNEWRGTTYPVVPGHEIVGRVVRSGKKAKKFKPGDLAAVGCMAGSCRKCPACREGLEQYCRKEPVWTYNSPDRHSGGMTYGGYSNNIVAEEDFVLEGPHGPDPGSSAPLLCAGITTYSPLRHWGVGKGRKAGVVGLGGLGHMAVKFAHAFGAETVLFTTTPAKAADGKRLGADAVVVSSRPEEMKKHLGSFHFILDTAGTAHDLNPYLELLRRDGTMCLLGVPASPHPAVAAMHLILNRRQLAGSVIGGIKETQEMLDFCGKKKIVSDVEVIPIQKIDAAYERMLKSDVRYRFVIDLSSL